MALALKGDCGGMGGLSIVLGDEDRSFDFRRFF